MRKLYHMRSSVWLVLGLLICNLTFSTNIFAAQQMKQKDILKLIDRARDAWIARDADALAQLFTPDGELIVPGRRWRGQGKIREQVSQFAREYLDVKIDIRQIIVKGDRAVIEWHYEDTEKATGLRNRADDAIVVNFKGNRISRWREYFDDKTPSQSRNT